MTDPVIVQTVAGIWTPIAVSVIGIIIAGVLKWNASRADATAKGKIAIDVVGNALENALGAMQAASPAQLAVSRNDYPQVSPQLAVGLSYMQNHAGPEIATVFGPQGLGGRLLPAIANHLAEKLQAKVGGKAIESNVNSAMPLAPLAPTLSPVDSPTSGLASAAGA